jgi:hypothetical protein
VEHVAEILVSGWLLSRGLAALLAWLKRKEKPAVLKQPAEPPKRAAREIRSLRAGEIEPWLAARRDESHNQGWRRLQSPEDFQASVPDSWLRPRRRHRWLK